MKRSQPCSSPARVIGPTGKRLLLLLLAAAALSSAQCFPAREKTVVARVIHAYGGRGALSRISSLAAEGNIMTYMPKDGGTYFFYLKRSGKLLVDIKYAKRTEKRILNGDRGYSGTDEAVAAATGPAYDAMVYQYNQLDLPYGLLDDAFRVAYLRGDRLGGRPVTVLKFTDRAGNEMEAAVDSENYHIVKTTALFRVGQDKARLSAAFSDFRVVDGVVLPFTIVNYADGFKISETKFANYTINPDIGDSVFSP